MHLIQTSTQKYNDYIVIRRKNSFSLFYFTGQTLHPEPDNRNGYPPPVFLNSDLRVI